MNSSGAFPRLSFNNNKSWKAVPYPLGTLVSESACLLYQTGPDSDHWSISGQPGKGAYSTVRLGIHKSPFNSNDEAAATTTNAAAAATIAFCTITATDYEPDKRPTGAARTASTVTTAAETSVADGFAIKRILNGSPDQF